MSWESTVPSVTSESDKSQVGLVSCHFMIKYHDHFYFSFKVLFQPTRTFPAIVSLTAFPLAWRASCFGMTIPFFCLCLSLWQCGHKDPGWDTLQNLGNGKLWPKICRAVLQFRQVRFHSLAISRSLLGVVWSCRELPGIVGSLLGVVWSCRDLSGVCREFVGSVIWCGEVTSPDKPRQVPTTLSEVLPKN